MEKKRVRSIPRADERLEYVVLADGSYPIRGVAGALLANAQRVVCCDGASINYIAHGGEPYAIVGDCDSITDEIRKQYGDRIHCETEQESNDLTKTIRYCLSQGIGDITILGATGRRDDHSIGNVGLLAEYVGFEGVERVRIITDCGVFEPMKRYGEFECTAGQQISIFTPNSSTKITTHNLRYPLKDEALKGWWQGTLNETLGDSFAIESDGVAIIYRVF